MVNIRDVIAGATRVESDLHVEKALLALRAGRPVVVADDESRENEGDLVFAAQHATTELLAFTVRHTSGVICAPLAADTCDRLALPPMVAMNEDAKGTAYTVSVDLRARRSTGISAADRAATLRALANAGSNAGDFTRPGHVFPLRARPGGVIARPGHTEAGIDLARLAGFGEAAAIAELVHDDGEMMRLPALKDFAARHDLPFLTIEALIAYRLRHDALWQPLAEARTAMRAWPFAFAGFRAEVHGVSGPAHVSLRLEPDFRAQHEEGQADRIIAGLAERAAVSAGRTLSSFESIGGTAQKRGLHLVQHLLEAG